MGSYYAQKDRRRKDTGRLGEQLAAQYLSQRGFRIIERNYRKPWGEIDIIAEKHGVVRFVEVKSISREKVVDVSCETSRAGEHVTKVKLKRLGRVIETYVHHKKIMCEYQVDVVTVVIDRDSRTAVCRLYEQVL